MKVVDQNPVYQFPYNEIDTEMYTILTEIEDKSYFKRVNSYNFLSIDFFKYRLLRFRTYIKCYHGKEKLKRVMYAAEHYATITKHIRGYSTLEMQLIRNIGLRTGYNCVIRRKIFEFVYTSIFFSSLKQFFIDNYYNNRNHYKEYLLWLYFRVVKTKINGKAVNPASSAFSDEKMELWSKEGVFIVCMGLSSKGEEYYSYSPYYEIIKNNEMDERKIRKMYNNFKNQKLK